MNSKLGKILTIVALAAIYQMGFAQTFDESDHDDELNFISQALVDVGVNEPQDAIGIVIGIICPSGAITNADFQQRCNEVAGAGLSANPTAGDGLQAMAPEEDAVVASSSVDSSSGHIDNVGNRISAARGASVAAAHSNGFNWSTGAAGDGTSPWGFFINGLYVSADRDATSRESGFESDDYGVTGGIDYTFSHKFIFGLAFGYKNSDADIDANGGKLETDSISYFAYWSIYPDDAWYIDAIAGYTDNDHDQVRNVIYTIGGPGSGLGTGSNTINNSAISDTESDEISVSVTAGHNFYNGPLTFSPYGRVEYADIEIDGFTERMSMSVPTALGSGLALNIDDQDFESLTLTFGATASTQWGDRFFPHATAEYVHEFENDNASITGRFVNDSSGTTFFLPTDRPDRDFFNLGVGITAIISDRITGFARYQALLGYRDLDVHAVEAGIRFGF